MVLIDLPLADEPLIGPAGDRLARRAAALAIGAATVSDTHPTLPTKA